VVSSPLAIPGSGRSGAAEAGGNQPPSPHVGRQRIPQLLSVLGVQIDLILGAVRPSLLYWAYYYMTAALAGPGRAPSGAGRSDWTLSWARKWPSPWASVRPTVLDMLDTPVGLHH
jgi:hypothetical protein